MNRSTKGNEITVGEFRRLLARIKKRGTAMDALLTARNAANELEHGVTGNRSVTVIAPQLSPARLEALRAHALRVKPWERSTGPRTPEGKARSRMNAKKHDERSAEAVARGRELWALYRMVRDDGEALRAIMREERGRIDG